MCKIDAVGTPRYEVFNNLTDICFPVHTWIRSHSVCETLYFDTYVIDSKRRLKLFSKLEQGPINPFSVAVCIK